MSEQVVVFTLNDRVFATQVSQVQEIVSYRDVKRVPELPCNVDGIIYLRNTNVPVFELNRRFGLGETTVTKKNKVIITQVNGKQLGFAVNDVKEIIKMEKEDIEPVPTCIYGTANTYIKSIGKKGDELISILDLSKILTSHELEETDKINVKE